MGFVLKIYLLGLMAFVPSPDGREMTILVVDAGRGFTTSDNSVFPPHYPVLLARAGSCAPDCRCEVKEIGPHLYVKKDPEAEVNPGVAEVNPGVLLPTSPDPAGALRQLVRGGGAWALTGSEISISHPGETSLSGRAETDRSQPGGLVLAAGRRTPDRNERATMPATPEDKEDFSWVVPMAKVAPSSATVDPDCLVAKPTRCPIAGRLTLTEGTFKTHKLAEYYKPGAGGIAEFAFAPAGAALPTGGPVQAIADWTAIEIQVPSCEISFTVRPFDGKPGTLQRITLSPGTCDGTGEVEVALLNLPDLSSLGTVAAHDHPGATGDGSHFEVFYELSSNRPVASQRPIPRLTGTFVPPGTAGQQAEPSPLLDEYRASRAGTVSRPICTQALFAPQ